jgi:hypothetical protein
MTMDQQERGVVRIFLVSLAIKHTFLATVRHVLLSIHSNWLSGWEECTRKINVQQTRRWRRPANGYHLAREFGNERSHQQSGSEAVHNDRWKRGCFCASLPHFRGEGAKIGPRRCTGVLRLNTAVIRNSRRHQNVGSTITLLTCLLPPWTARGVSAFDAAAIHARRRIRSRTWAHWPCVEARGLG